MKKLIDSLTRIDKSQLKSKGLVLPVHTLQNEAPKKRGKSPLPL